MKKVIFSLTIFLGILFFNRPLFAEEIQEFNSQIKINKDGTINVQEIISYDFGNLEKHGIYRTIPAIKTNQKGKKYRLSFSDISVVDKDNNLYQYSKTYENDNLKLKIGDPDKTVSGVHTYVIKYKVSGALTYFSDHDELYWNITGNDWDVPILLSTPEVVLTDGVRQSERKIICYVGYAGSTETGCQSRVLQAKEGMTVVVSFPKNIVAVLEPKEVIPFFDTLLGKFTLILLMIISFLWYVVYPIWIPIKWYLYGRDPNVSGPVRSWYDPPQTGSGRPLTAIETGSLVDESVDMKDISAMIIQLAQKGYFQIVEKKKGDFSFVRRSLDEAGLQDFEKKFLTGIFGNKKEIRLKDEKLYEPVKELKDNLYQDLVKENFFVKNPNSVRNFYAIIFGLASFTFNVPLLLATVIFGRIMPRKTMLGVQTANVGRSLKNFLSSQERQLEFLVEKSNLPAGRQVFFEKLLPFAVAFGVEKVWAKRFSDINMTSPDWYQGYSRTNFNSLLLINSMNSSFSSFRSAATLPTSSSSGFSSGFSGGFSGGGGGGGGGGSW